MAVQDHPEAGRPSPIEPTLLGANGGPATRSERLDRLPFTRAHVRLLGGSGIGWALDAMDVGLMSFIMAALAQQWNLGPTELSWLASIGVLGMSVGATLGGLLADRFGRRQVFAGTLLVYGLATGASALVGSVAALIALRFVVGLGLGAELPVAATLVSEYSPRAIRGRMVVALESFWALGWLLAALIGYLVVPASPDGWRWALALGVVPAVYAVYVRFGLPESVRFLESRGRTREAEAAVRVFEASAGIPAPSVQDHVAGESISTPVVTQPAPRPRIWAPHLRGRTAALWTLWFMVNFSYYGAFMWLPTLLVSQGMSLVTSAQYTLIITLAQLPGYAVSALLIEIWGRRPTLAAFLVGSAAAAGLMALADSPSSIIAAGMAMSFFNLGAWGALYAISPEVYPTSVRGSGVGAAAGFGRIAAFVAPMSVPFIRQIGGIELLFTVFGAAFVLAAVATLGLRETRGEALADH